jgi:lysophospholipase L1-like esterase
MKAILHATILLALSCVHCSGQANPWQTLFAPGTQVLAIGDSITHGFSAPATIKGDHYHGLLQFFFAIRYPARDLWMANAGRSGDNLTGLVKDRLNDRDVYKTLPGVVEFPDVALVMYGMNDGGSLGYISGKHPTEATKQQRRNTFTNKLQQAITHLISQGVTPVILSPTMYDETTDKNVIPAIGYNAELAIYKNLAQQMAVTNNLFFVDVHTLMTQLTPAKQALDIGFSYTSDRVHPHSGGSNIAFYNIIKALGIEGDVFRVKLRAGRVRPGVETASNTAVSALTDTGGAITWTAAENALPFPINTTAYRYDRAFADIPFAAEFNTQALQVTGLPTNDYILRINGTTIATYSSAALAAGIDLSTQTGTPQYGAAFALREQLYRKQVIDIIKRDLNSTRLNMESYYESDTDGADPVVFADLLTEDWDNPDATKIIGYLDRQHQEILDSGKSLGNFFSHISRQTRTHLPNIVALNAELAALRTQVMALPASRSYEYSLAPVSGNTGGGPVTHEQWRQSRFTPAELQNPAVSSITADPETDGLVNLIEYALDTEPQAPDTGSTGIETDPQTQARYFYYTKWRGDVTYRVESSATLTGFSSAGIDQQGVDTAPIGASIRVPLPAGGNIFARLVISLQ